MCEPIHHQMLHDQGPRNIPEERSNRTEFRVTPTFFFNAPIIHAGPEKRSKNVTSR